MTTKKIPAKKKKSAEVPQGTQFRAWCEARELKVPDIAKTLEISERTVFRMFEGKSRVRRSDLAALEE